MAAPEPSIGSITRIVKGGRPRYRVRITVHGHRFDTTLVNRRAAKERLAELRRLADLSPGAVKPFTEFLDDWLDVSILSPHTLSTYRTQVELRIRPHLGELRMYELDGFVIDQFFRGLQRDGATPSQLRHTRVALLSALKTAVRWRCIAQTPAVTPPSRL